MTDTTTEATTKRGRNCAVILTDRMCEKRVAERDKMYDRKAPGLYISRTPAGMTAFNFKFTHPTTGKQRSIKIGEYNPETFGIDAARSKVYAMKAMDPAELVELLAQKQVERAAQGKTADEIIEERIDWMKTPVLKADGEMRPRIESWANVASHLRRFLSPRLGKKAASAVTKRDIATLSDDIVAGDYPGSKASVANARHMRRAASGLFNWAAEAGREYVTASPCVHLPPLDKEHARTRVLSAEEIRVFWRGLDRDDLPWSRNTCLALKFELVTMLRSGELLAAHRDELFDLDGEFPRFDVPARRVKKRRTIGQPLSSLAVGIIKEATAREGQQFVFESPVYEGQPIHRTALATALRGTKHEKHPGKSKTSGLCELLGLKRFTPHDLRRTAATLAGELGYSDAAIAKCLDHAVTKDDGEKISRVTGIYNQSKREKQKRQVLDGIAAELRRIISEPAVKTVDHQGLRLAA
jgi:integrase